VTIQVSYAAWADFGPGGFDGGPIGQWASTGHPSGKGNEWDSEPTAYFDWSDEVDKYLLGQTTYLIVF